VIIFDLQVAVQK